jgi:hypothetical protein
MKKLRFLFLFAFKLFSYSWKYRYLQTTKVWLQDGTRGELKCAPDSNGIIGRQFQPANPDNRAGSNIIETRRNIIQRIQVFLGGILLVIFL